MDLQELKEKKLAPEWLTDEGLTTLQNGYLLEGESPKDMWKRVCAAAAKRLKKPKLEDKFFELFWNNWLCGATPVLSNMGTSRGLPISCNSLHVGDSIRSIFEKQTELALLSKNGAGVGIYVGDVRGRGANIAGNGKSEGVIPWLKCYDSTTVAVSQGSVRRGASAVYLPVEHSDIEEFINVRRPVGDVNRRCLNLHHAVCIKDDFMQKVKDGGEHERYLWKEILKARFETGEPYLFFSDNVERQKPECYVKNGLDIKTSNICVTGDQRVVTSNGIKTVYELYNSKEDLILFDGEKPVKASKMHLIEKNAKVFKITTKEGRAHNLTEYHKVLTDHGLVECKNLIVGDKVKVQRNEGLFGSINMPEMAFLLGLYHGDGTQTNDKVFIDIWENDFKLQDEIKNCIDTVYEKNNWMEYTIGGDHGKFNRKTIVPNFISQQTGFSNVKKLRLGSAKLKQFGFKKNIIPEWIWNGNKETQSQYLRGLFITDGTVRISDSKKVYGNPIYLSLASVSLDLLRNVQIILSNTGINSKIYKLHDKREEMLPNGKGSYSKYECQPAWRLNITDKNSALKFENLTKFLSYKGILLEDRQYRDNTKKFDSIKSIEQIENQDVYCTTVESDEHVWVCNSFITSNCNEIYLYTDPDHTFVCCLSSMNLFKYDEWKNTNAVQLSIWFLDAVIQEYIDKAKSMPGFESAVRFAEKSRALGLGVLGWHSLLQKKNIPFDSFQAMMLNGEIFRHMQKESQIATKDLAKEYGEPEWCKGFGIRNTHQLAVAPTVSNSIISGSVSAGIEPISANVVALKTAKGTFMRTNPILKQLLADKGMDHIDVWKQINENNGSVADLKCLNENEKEVFLTAREINQHSIIKQAGQRQKYIDQGQSVNLFFAKNSDPRYIHSVHMLAWEEGLKGLYYCRSEAALKGDSVNRQKDECKACEG